jgi:hypothetical protein
LKPVRLLAVLALWFVVLFVLLAGRVPESRAQAALQRAADNTCTVVSCTVYLPLILRPEPVVAAQFEVTQGVQQPDNSVRLVANRPTYVRWTLTASTAYTNVSALLYGTRNGAALAGSPLSALNNPRTLKPTANRAALGDTFNFRLPDSWASGDIQLVARAANASGYDVKTADAGFHFNDSVALAAKVVPIEYHCSNSSAAVLPGPAPYTYLTSYTFQTYPVPAIGLSSHAALPFTGPCYNDQPTPSSSDWSAILNNVTTVWNTEGNPDSYYYGLLKIYCGSSCISGIGWIGWPVAAGFDGFGTTHSGASETHAHEVGHNHGRRHSAGCGAGGADTSFPYVYADGKARLGNDVHQNYGFNIDTQAIYPYASNYDYMSYCDPAWTSDYTYNKIWEYANSVLRRRNLAPVAASRSWVISGRIDPQTDRAVFDPAYVIDLPARAPEPGEYVLELLDRFDRVVAAYPFELLRAPIEDSQRTGESLSFHLRIPYHDQAVTLRITHHASSIGVLRASANPPRLTAVTRSASARLDNSVHWSGQDADGNTLSYLVRASIDQGKTWQTIGVNLTTPSITLRPEDFGGHQVTLEILGSDGVFTSKLQTGSYWVEEQ